MATTVGFVQRLLVQQPSLACALVGPTPTSTAAFFVQGNAGEAPEILAWKASLVDGLTTAMATRQQVQVAHGDSDSAITGLTLSPG